MAARAARIARRIPMKNFVAGRWAAVQKSFPVINPCSNETICEQPNDPAAATAAMEAAFQAEALWRSTLPEDRGEALNRIADNLEKRKAWIAEIESLNTGKPLKEAEGDVDEAVTAFRYCASEAIKGGQPGGVFTERLADGMDHTGDYRGEITHEAIGTVVGICPFNYPLMMAAWKAAPALAAGCPIVLKPSELTPLTTLALAQAAEDTGMLPPGVLQVVCGDGAVGDALARSPLGRKLSFTGSGPTGERVMQVAARGARPVVLELGGKSPAIVMPDADLDTAVEHLLFSTYWNAGQICSSTARMIVHESIHGEIKESLAEAVKGLRVGGPFEHLPGDDGLVPPAGGSGSGTGSDSESETSTGWEGCGAAEDERANELGPVISTAQRDKVFHGLRAAKAAGATLLAGSFADESAGDRIPEGCFVEPTLLDGVVPGTPLWSTEIFGPVGHLATYKTEEEAVAMANDSEFGLAAAVFGGDDDAMRRVARGIRAGTVWENCAQPVPPQLPWGGMGESGIGREMGPNALGPFLEAKTLCKANKPGEPLGWYTSVASARYGGRQ